MPWFVSQFSDEILILIFLKVLKDILCIVFVNYYGGDSMFAEENGSKEHVKPSVLKHWKAETASWNGACFTTPTVP